MKIVLWCINGCWKKLLRQQQTIWWCLGGKGPNFGWEKGEQSELIDIINALGENGTA